ncbi:MAG: hypothetical protein GC155_06205 [Alphaproteobacteria bacterium]|nr:hypothetical protein [Alphaproteobacteria bacterium]
MTAVAYRNGVLAVDSLAQNGGFKLSPPADKAVAVEIAVGQFALVAGAGSAVVVDRVRAWALANLKDWARRSCPVDELPEIGPDDDTTVFILLPDGRHFALQECGGDRLTAPFFATGEFTFLLGAMAVGASAASAVAAAAEYSVHCGWPIRIYDHKKGFRIALQDMTQVRNWDRAERP